MKRIHVVLAVIVADDGRVLLSRRADDAHLGGFWEFPGGKVDAGESEPETLVRELQEELGMTPTAFHHLIRVCHDYPDRQVELSAWTVHAWQGPARLGDRGREGQPLAWVAREALSTIPFPVANAAIVAAARLPLVWRVTPNLANSSDVLSWALLRLAQQSSACHEGWLLRLPDWAADAYVGVATEVVRLAADAGVPVLLHGDPAQLLAVPLAAGVHLPASLAARLAPDGRPSALSARHLLSVAAHNHEELALASLLAADCAFLSPVLPTLSHPGQPALGWSAWSALAGISTVPVYAMGGMSVDDLAQARLAGAQGVAGISGF